MGSADVPANHRHNPSPETADAGALDAAWEALADALWQDAPSYDPHATVDRHRPLIEHAVADRTADIVLRGVAEAGAARGRRDATLALDVAWAKVVAALPLAGWTDPTDGRWVIPSGTWTIDIRRAESGDGYFEPVEDGYWATAKVDAYPHPFAIRGDLGPSAAEAVASLARALRAAESPTPEPDGEAGS